MSKRLHLFRWAVAAAGLALAAVGCSAILGIESLPGLPGTDGGADADDAAIRPDAQPADTFVPVDSHAPADSELPDSALSDSTVPDSTLIDSATLDSSAPDAEVPDTEIREASTDAPPAEAAQDASEAGSSECVINGTSVQSGASNPSNACQTCDPMTNPADWTTLPDGTSCGASQICNGGACVSGCVVMGTFYAPDASSMSNACEVCDPAMSTGALSTAPNGASCGSGQTCAAGVCGNDCDIDGGVVMSGAKNPANACLTCQPGTNATAWSQAPSGTPNCGSGEYCTMGGCVVGCYIGQPGLGTSYVPGSANPANACQTCVPSTSSTALTNVADGTSCGGSMTCFAGSCTGVCATGQTRCASSTQPQTCSPAGTWQNATACSGAAPVCAGGSCGPLTCTKVITTTLNEPNPLGSAVTIGYAMVGGGGGGGLGGGGTNGSVASGSVNLGASSTIAVYVGGGGGFAYYSGGGGGAGYFGGGGGGGGGNGGGGGGGSSAILTSGALVAFAVGGGGGTGASNGTCAGCFGLGGAGGSNGGGAAGAGGSANAGKAGSAGSANAGGPGGSAGYVGGAGGNASTGGTAGGGSTGGGGGYGGGGGGTGGGGTSGASGAGNAGFNGGLGSLTWAFVTALPQAAGGGGAFTGSNSGIAGGNGGLVILTYVSPTGSCSL